MNADAFAQFAVEAVARGAAALPAPGKELPPLREFFIELTYRCDQKCLMCDVWPRSRAATGEEMTPAEIAGLLSSSTRFRDLELAVLTGGEPFLRPDLAEIAAHFLQTYPRLRLGILTNGFNTAAARAALADLRRRGFLSRVWLGSSLDGIGEIHDRVRGVPGAFAALERTLREVRMEFPEAAWSLNFTITPLNFRALPEALRFALARGLDFSAQFPIPWPGVPPFKWSADDWAALEKIGRETIREMVADRIREKGEAALKGDRDFLARIYYWQGLFEYGRRPRRLFGACKAGRECAMFSPRGDLYFCPRYKHEPAGNIRNTPFDRLWNSPAAASFRRRSAAGGCHCWLNCMAYSFATRALEKAV